MTSKTNAPARGDLQQLETSQRYDGLKKNLYYQSACAGVGRKEGRVSKGEKMSVTLFAAEEDSDIIFRQLLSVSFHFSVVFVLPDYLFRSASLPSYLSLISYRKAHGSSDRRRRSVSPTARLVVVGQVVFCHVACCLCCFICRPGPWRGCRCANFFCLRVFSLHMSAACWLIVLSWKSKAKE